MHREEKESCPPEEPPFDHAWAVVLSVLTVMAGLFLGLPWLLVRIHVAAWLPAVLLLVPAFPTVTGWLQGSMTCRISGEWLPRSLFREYLLHLWSLGLELTLLLACLPVIAARLLGVIVAIMFIAFTVVLMLACAQQVFGWRMEGISVFTWSDVWFSAKLTLATVAATLGCFGLGAMLERMFDRGADVAAVANRRVMNCLQRFF